MSLPRPYYQHGGIVLYHGDCMGMLPDLPGIDAVVTDPPYGIAIRNNDKDGHRSERTFAIEGDNDNAAGIALLAWAESRNLPTIAFASPWAPWPGEWRNLIAWDKGGAVGGGGDVRTCLKRSWELVQVARNGPMRGNRDVSVWRFPMVPPDTAEHIAAKPPKLMQALVRRFTDGIVLDPFARQ